MSFSISAGQFTLKVTVSLFGGSQFDHLAGDVQRAVRRAHDVGTADAQLDLDRVAEEILSAELPIAPSNFDVRRANFIMAISSGPSTGTKGRRERARQSAFFNWTNQQKKGGRFGVRCLPIAPAAAVDPAGFGIPLRAALSKLHHLTQAKIGLWPTRLDAENWDAMSESGQTRKW
jgi:hypothetical protein